MLADGDKNGCTAVHWSSYKGDIQALKFLHYFKADLNVVDSAKMLPLHRACCASQAVVAEFLIENKSDPEARNADGKTCLDIAAEKHDVQLQALLKKLTQKPGHKGSKVEITDLEAGKDEDSGDKSKKGGGFFKSLMQDKAAHKIFPVFWLVCVSFTLFEYIMDFRQSSYEVAPWLSLAFEVMIPMSLCVFASVALGDPGKIPAGPQGRTGVEELMKAIDTYVPGRDKEPTLDRLCMTTWVMKGLRTKYCKETGACIEEFDHYCVWLNNAIGKGNHRQFVSLAVVEFWTQVVFLILAWQMAVALVPYKTVGQWTYTVVTQLPLLVLIALIHLLTAPWVLMLLIHQARSIFMNLTTNEMMNLHRYEHFWVTTGGWPGAAQRAYQNPFHKGSRLGNFMDFFWHRRRSEMVPQPPPVVQQPGQNGHVHNAG